MKGWKERAKGRPPDSILVYFGDLSLHLLGFRCCLESDPSSLLLMFPLQLRKGSGEPFSDLIFQRVPLCWACNFNPVIKPPSVMLVPS